MKHFVAALLVASLAACSHTLPKPNNPQTAGVEALVAYGLAAHVAGQYLALPFCTKPLTVFPCKTPEIAAKVKLADTAAYNAAVAADAAANGPNAVPVAQNAAEKLENLKHANAEANGGKQ